MSSTPVTISVIIEDTNDNGPSLELFDSEIDVKDSEILAPFLFLVSSILQLTMSGATNV